MCYLTIIVTNITVERRTVICQIIPVNCLGIYRTDGCNWLRSWDKTRSVLKSNKVREQFIKGRAHILEWRQPSIQPFRVRIWTQMQILKEGWARTQFRWSNQWKVSYLQYHSTHFSFRTIPSSERRLLRRSCLFLRELWGTTENHTASANLLQEERQALWNGACWAE